MNRKASLLTVTGFLLIAFTLGATPVSANDAQLHPCIPNGTASTTNERLGLGGPCCELVIPLDAGAEHLHPCIPPCIPTNGDTIALIPCLPCDLDPGIVALGGGHHYDPCVPPQDPCDRFDLQATANDNGTVLLTYNLPHWARGVAIERDDGDGFEFLTGVAEPDDEYLDTSTEFEKDYVYSVAVHSPHGQGEPKFTCYVEVTTADEPPATCDDLALIANALDGGSIQLNWTLPDGARGVKVLRDGLQIAALPQPANGTLDTTAVIGETYVYVVEVHYPHDPDGELTLKCRVQITSVPVFGNALATGLAVSLALVGYLGARRRQ